MGNKYLMYNNQLWELSQKFEYTGSLQEFTLEPDTYLFVANGARGGRQPTDGKNRNEFISWGGTTYGILDLDHTQTFYAAVGGEGGKAASGAAPAGGWNGGGKGGLAPSTSYINGAGGGGATDVRLSSAANTYEEEPVFAPHGYDQVEYITSWAGDAGDGDGWLPGGDDYGNIIDTGYIIKPNTKIELVIEIKPKGEGGPGITFGGPIFGAGTNGSTFPKTLATAVRDDGNGPYLYENDKVYAAYMDMRKYEWGSPEWQNARDNMYIYSHGKITFTLDGDTMTYASEDGEINYTLGPVNRTTCEYSMYLFGINIDGHPSYYYAGDYADVSEIARMRFYYMKIWEGNELVHWYVPIARATDPGFIAQHTDTAKPYWTDEEKNIMRNRGIFDLVDKKSYFGLIKENTLTYAGRMSYYFGIGHHVAPIDQDHYSTKTVEKINGAQSRILVAGGGGGTSVMHDSNNTPDYYSFGGGALAGCISGPNVTTENNADLRATDRSGYSFGVGADAENRGSTPSSGYSNANGGQGGGGGGWYGGYAIIGKSDTKESHTSYGGTGGSSYVLTASSYKPAGYMADYADIMESLYFRNTLMLPYQAFDGSSVEIYKLATSKPLAGDTVVAPFVGYWQHADLLPSQYRIKCYGGDGGTRTYNSVASKGGYAEGVLNLPDTRSLFFHVGASSFLVGTKTTPAERTSMFAKTLYYQTKNLGNSVSGTELLATQPGGSVDVRTEQTGNVEKLITIPDEYDELEYLETDGTQRIQFTWYQSSQYVQYEIVCNLTDTGAQQCLFGVMSGTTTRIGIFPVYDPLDPQLTFMNKNEFACDGSQMPFGSKITLKIIDTHMSWYDAAGTKLGEITTTKERQGQMGYPIYLFDCNNVGSPLNANTVGKLYSFKVTEVKPNETKIQHWYLPCVSKSDPNKVGLYDFVTRTFITRYNTSTMHPFTAGPIIQEKSALRVVVDNTNISRYSRFIVAGGGGGQGSPIGLGGDGGGLEGAMCKGTATDSTVLNVGRQNGGLFFEYSTGGGKYQTAAYLGAGGWGWYSGYSAKNGTSSSQPAASTKDINKGGSGGSGYVLTADSYKPSFSNWTYDDRFYLSDTVLTTGGNPVRGMTKIVMDVLDSSAAKLSIIAGDGESYKAYDISNNTWWSITGVATLTPEVFDEFGVPLQSILSDEGLTFPYRLYLCDPFNSGANKIWTYVIPQTQHVSFTHQCAIREVNNYVLDDELDESISASLQYETTNQGISTDISVTMNDVPTKDSYVYMVQYNVDKLSTTDTFKPQEISKSGKEVVLYSTAKNKIASAYKDYPNTLMPDGKTIITSVENTSSCEYQRKIYTVSSINGQVFRITEYDMATDSFSIIRDNIHKSWVSGSGATGGSLLIKDNVAYLFNSFIFNPSLAPGDLIIAVIPFSQSENVTQYLSRNIPNADLSCRSTCYGQSYWYSETETISCAVNGFITFDINSHEMTHHPDSVNAGDTGATSFALGKYTIIKCIYDANGTTTVHAFNRETLLGVPGYTMEFPNGTRCVCYDNNRFYIAQPGLLYILQDQANCKPTLISTITIPNATLQPKTIDCSNGCVYITFDNSDSMYVYTISLQRWSIVELPFTVPASATTGWLRPATFGGYVFIGNLGMFVANANIGGKYGIGERNSFIHIFPNESYANNMTYNDRFITPDEKGLHIHMGYIDKNLSPIALDSCIYQTQEYVSTDYKRMFHHSFRQGD